MRNHLEFRTSGLLQEQTIALACDRERAKGADPLSKEGRSNLFNEERPMTLRAVIAGVTGLIGSKS